MTALMARLLGRLPIGWLQLKHNRGRLAAAVAGVAFADILVLMQLGFLGALELSTRLPYGALEADILISASDANTLTDGSAIPRQRMLQALAVPGVAGAAALHVGKLDWRRSDGETTSLTVFGVDPTSKAFSDPSIAALQPRLTILDTALIDLAGRGLPDYATDALDPDAPRRIELGGRSIDLIGGFQIGAGFEADAYLIVSDETFLRLFPGQTVGTPKHILVRAEPDTTPDVLVERLRTALPSIDTRPRTFESAARADEAYQTTERPVGIVFGFGTVMGLLVGVVIVYQILSTDVADHIREYATLKAVGYPQHFFLGVIMEQAVILGFIGFGPGLLAALLLYDLVSQASGLPLEMSFGRAAAVFVGTVALCLASGAAATRRLAAADPAELF